MSSTKWTNGDEGIDSVECKHPTSSDLCHLHEVEHEISIDVNGWWRSPCKSDEGCTNSSARWWTRCSRWYCKYGYIYINIIHFLSKLQAYSVHRYLYACCHTLAVHSITKLGTMAKCVAIANEIMNVDLLWKVSLPVRLKSWMVQHM